MVVETMIHRRVQNVPRVALEKDKRLLVLRHRIVSVLKIIVLVPMVLLQRVHHVPPTMLTFVRLVAVTITKLATHALDAQRVALEQQKRLIVLRHRIVSVLKIIVLVPMVMQPQAQHVLPMVITFVRLVTVTITKLATHALNA